MERCEGINPIRHHINKFGFSLTCSMTLSKKIELFFKNQLYIKHTYKIQTRVSIYECGTKPKHNFFL